MSSYVSRKKEIMKSKLGGRVTEEELLELGVISGLPKRFADLVTSVIAVGGALPEVETALREKSANDEITADIHQCLAADEEEEEAPQRKKRKKSKSTASTAEANTATAKTVKAAVETALKAAGIQKAPKKGDYKGGKKGGYRSGGGGYTGGGGGYTGGGYGGGGYRGGFGGGFGKGGYNGGQKGGFKGGFASGSCHRCGQFGHMAWQCPNAITPGGSSSSSTSIPEGYELVKRR